MEPRLQTESKCYISNIPLEVLVEIFLYYCKSGNHCIPPLSPHPAFILSLVCSDWRSVALSLPTFWSDIQIKVSEELDYSSDHIDWMLFFAKLYLMRSGQSPLDIVLRVPVAYNDWEIYYRHRYNLVHDGNFQLLYNLFSEVSHRWRSMSLSGFEEDWIDNYTWQANLPVIERLELVSVYHHTFSLNHGVTFDNLSAPSLQELTLVGDWNTSVDQPPALPALTQLIVKPWPSDLMAFDLSLLTLANPLTSVKIIGFHLICHPGGQQLIRCLGKSLEIRPLPSSQAQRASYELLGYLDLPHIRTLHLEPVIVSREEEIHALLATSSFIRSMEHIDGTLITQLILHHFVFEKAYQFLNFLGSFPALTHLSLNESHHIAIPQDELELEQPVETVLTKPAFYDKLNTVFEDCILRELEDINLVVDFGESVPGSALLNMLESRFVECGTWEVFGGQRASPLLQRFRLVFDYGLNGLGPEETERLKAMQERGFDIEITASRT
ncbi:hypothetical protein K435DRAFT_778141 [Dendrothele bispora CBS 962.96]|uniref:Uncharacterized protein n=1 Tax=Dendrothele bispora (strain CBS 962.96) TaxID=1314807 RepID=A0A4S8M5C3_DENBC|nr:hypothetical protein K435DRAFT_778141 [Dendrothele bispora CBS 962.96]